MPKARPAPPTAPQVATSARCWHTAHARACPAHGLPCQRWPPMRAAPLPHASQLLDHSCSVNCPLQLPPPSCFHFMCHDVTHRVVCPSICRWETLAWHAAHAQGRCTACTVQSATCRPRRCSTELWGRPPTCMRLVSATTQCPPIAAVLEQGPCRPVAGAGSAWQGCHICHLAAPGLHVCKHSVSWQLG
jgi:hypothetical protein